MGFTNKVISEIPAVSGKTESEPAVKNNVLTSEPKSNIELPFTGYSEIHKRPYTVDYFKIDYYKELDDKTDVNDIRNKVSKIESFVKGEIEARKLKDSINSYKSIIEGVLELVGKDDKGEKLITRLAEYANLAQKKRESDSKYNKLIARLGLLNG